MFSMEVGFATRVDYLGGEWIVYIKGTSRYLKKIFSKSIAHVMKHGNFQCH